MRVRSCSVLLAIVSLTATPLAAQTLVPSDGGAFSFSLGVGVARHGPLVTGGLEYAMNRWLAARTDVIHGFNGDDSFHATTRMTAIGVAAAVSAPEKLRITPYLFSGFAASASQGRGLELGPLGGAGFRVNLGRFSPYLEARVQHRIGVPISVGIRF